MNRYIVILMACILVLQIEMAALLWLHKQNLGVWRAQAELNASLTDVAVNYCMLQRSTLTIPEV